MRVASKSRKLANGRGKFSSAGDSRRRVSRGLRAPMPRRRKAAEGTGSKGTSEAPPLPLEARDLSTADPYEQVIPRPERSRTRQRSRRPSGPQESSPVEQAAEQERFRTKTRRRVDGAGAAAADAGAGIRRLSRHTISPVHDAARVPLEGPLDAFGRHPSMRKLSQVVLHGDEPGSRGGTNPSQSVPSSEARQRVRAGRRSGGAAALKKPRSRSPPQAAAGDESPSSRVCRSKGESTIATLRLLGSPRISMQQVGNMHLRAADTDTDTDIDTDTYTGTDTARDTDTDQIQTY